MILREAKNSANSIIASLSPYCSTVLSAGAIRRNHETAIDVIEIVAIPKPECLLEIRKVANHQFGVVSEGRFPSKLTKIRRPIKIDIHWIDRRQFGWCLFWLTGPMTFVGPALQQWEVSNNRLGCVMANRLYRRPDGEVEETPDETDVFRLLDGPFVRPEDRRIWK